MDIIKTYLDNMFSALPKTKEVLKMKANMLSSMQDKYNELKNSGKTENEAIGIVISEFGNIDELAEEMGVDLSTTNNQPVISTEVAQNYLDVSKKMGLMIAIGVFLVIMGPVTLIFLTNGFPKFNLPSNLIDFIGLSVLFLLIASAVGLFIYGGTNLDKYNYLKSDVIIPKSTQDMVLKEKKNFDPKFVRSLIIGIFLYILSPAVLIGISFLGENNEYSGIGVCILLFMVATASGLIVRQAMIRNSHNALLRLEEYSPKSIKPNKIMNAIGGIYWPIVIAVYLLWSFTKDAWSKSWLVFPVAAVLFGAISSFVKLMQKD
jgi:hypothetical protein